MSRLGYQQRIKVRAEELRKVIAASQAELVELEVAERVLGRLAAGGDQHDDPDVVSGQPNRDREPTIADMAVRYLEEIGPLSSQRLLEHMQENWRPDLAATTLTSTLSRTRRTGKVVFKDGMWRITSNGDEGSPNENEPPEGGSEAEEVGASSDSAQGGDPGYPVPNVPDPEGQTRQRMMPGVE